MVLGDDVSLEASETKTDSDSVESHDPETLFILDSIIQRLKPRDAHHVRDMITERARTSGALFISSALWWWIAISEGSKQVNDSDIPQSTLGSFEFGTVSLIIPALVIAATLFTGIGRERGNATMNLIGGGLGVLAAFYILEPVLMHFGELEGDALFATGRVLVLAIMVGFASLMMFDALLLQWVRASMLHMGIEAFPPIGSDQAEGHADEESPYS
ncbi:MAG: hypothetical protein CMA12_01780 [Euryarchaeota archaeon]|nr:hypothetical protein [Euryarchaeota archaeon]OUW22964.1 MAG: hypothetical protein CBD33_00355 [Euryarchaeota archaeon TMED173]